MRVCASCLFSKQEQQQEETPAAALVLAFSSSRLRGAGGIVQQIETMSELKHLPMAAAYCTTCRKCTWLCQQNVTLNDACLQFLHAARTSEQIQNALLRMHT